MRVLVTGAGGQVGAELVGACRQAGDEVVACGRAELDVGDRDSVLTGVLSARPDVVVHAGAMTDVDACESAAGAELAWRDNALAGRWLAEACRRSGAHLVALSTDYVFAGDSTEPYHEWSPTGPRTVYGRTKLAAEEEVLGGLPGAAVVRTSWVSGGAAPGARNVVRTVLSLLASDPDRVLRFVDDQHGCPTLTSSLAPALRRLAATRVPGVLHVTNAGPTTWYGFALAVAGLAGYDAHARVQPTSTAALTPPRPAPRPANSVLEGRAWGMAGFEPLAHWSVPLERLVAEEVRSSA